MSKIVNDHPPPPPPTRPVKRKCAKSGVCVCVLVSLASAIEANNAMSHSTYHSNTYRKIRGPHFSLRLSGFALYFGWREWQETGNTDHRASSPGGSSVVAISCPLVRAPVHSYRPSRVSGVWHTALSNSILQKVAQLHCKWVGRFTFCRLSSPCPSEPALHTRGPFKKDTNCKTSTLAWHVAFHHTMYAQYSFTNLRSLLKSVTSPCSDKC